jgi:hypothetical protein
MDVKCKLEKKKEFIEMELAANIVLDAYEEDSIVEGNEVEAEEQEGESVGEKSTTTCRKQKGYPQT